MFLERCLELCAEGGTASLVLPQNWLFLTSYRKLREKLLKAETWHLLARLGPGAFETISGEVVKAILLLVSRCNASVRDRGTTSANTMHGLDVSEFRIAHDKAARLQEVSITGAEQARQQENPDARIVVGNEKKQDANSYLADFAQTYQGIGTSDNCQFLYKFWEQSSITVGKWMWVQTAANSTGFIGGCNSVLFWEDGQGRYFDHATSLKAEGRLGGWKSGGKAWGNQGFIVNVTRTPHVNSYLGSMFDTTVAAMVVDSNHQAAVYSYLTDQSYGQDLRMLDQALSITEHTLLKVGFDFKKWANIANAKYPNGLPKPFSDDPTQWIFHGHPSGSVVWDHNEKRTVHGPLRTNANVLQVATARLLGYRWPAEKEPAMELAGEQREWASRCEALLDHADDDGIVCIPSVRGEPSAEERLLDLLAHSFGNDWTNETVTRLLAETGAGNLDNWLRNHFFDRHSKLFHHRPFIWHIWDGRAHDGFHSLVNYHTLAAGEGKGRQCLESLTYSYLGDWIARQRDGVTSGKSGAEDRLAAALELQKRLKLILEGEPPFDIFVRWKSIEELPIGWSPDINDGVRLNIRPFMADDLPGGRKGAGILRVKPKIHWRKDPGKEPSRDREGFPWFWSCPGNGTTVERTDFSAGSDFDGNRWNNLHYTKAAKHAAQELRPLGEAGLVAMEGKDSHSVTAPALKAKRKHAK